MFASGKVAFSPPKVELTSFKLGIIQKAHTCNYFDSFVPKYASKFIKLLFVFKNNKKKKRIFFSWREISPKQRCLKITYPIVISSCYSYYFEIYWTFRWEDEISFVNLLQVHQSFSSKQCDFPNTQNPCCLRNSIACIKHSPELLATTNSYFSPIHFLPEDW